MKDIILSMISVEELQEIIYASVVKALEGQKIKTTDEMIGREELMKITGIGSYTTVIKYERLNLFKPRRIGKKIMYKRSEVLEVMRQFQRV